MNGKLHKLAREIRRMLPALVISIAVLAIRQYQFLPANSPLLLVLHRAALGTIGFCVAHIVRQPAFPYLDLESALKSPSPGEAVGAALLVGLIYLGFILGATLGF